MVSVMVVYSWLRGWPCTSPGLLRVRPNPNSLKMIGPISILCREAVRDVFSQLHPQLYGFLMWCQRFAQGLSHDATLATYVWKNKTKQCIKNILCGHIYTYSVLFLCTSFITYIIFHSAAFQIQWNQTVLLRRKRLYENINRPCVLWGDFFFVCFYTSKALLCNISTSILINWVKDHFLAPLCQFERGCSV